MHHPKWALLTLLALSACSDYDATNQSDYSMSSAGRCNVLSDDSAVDLESDFGLDVDGAVQLVESHLFPPTSTFISVDSGAALWSGSISVEVSPAGDPRILDREARLPTCVAGRVATLPVTISVAGGLSTASEPLTGTLFWNGATQDDVWLDLHGTAEVTTPIMDEAQQVLDAHAETPSLACADVDASSITYDVTRASELDTPLSVPSLAIGVRLSCMSTTIAEQTPDESSL